MEEKNKQKQGDIEEETGRTNKKQEEKGKDKKKKQNKQNKTNKNLDVPKTKHNTTKIFQFICMIYSFFTP